MVRLATGNPRNNNNAISLRTNELGCPLVYNSSRLRFSQTSLPPVVINKSIGNSRRLAINVFSWAHINFSPWDIKSADACTQNGRVELSLVETVNFHPCSSTRHGNGYHKVLGTLKQEMRMAQPTPNVSRRFHARRGLHHLSSFIFHKGMSIIHHPHQWHPTI